MTNEAFEQGCKLKNRIKEIDCILKDITPYLHNDVEITIQKQGCLLRYRLKSDDPLWLAIGSALKDMRAELQSQFDEIDCKSQEVPQDPIKKTKAWMKVWKIK